MHAAGTRRLRWFVLSLVALAAVATAPMSRSRASEPEGLPATLQGTVSWRYAQGRDGEFGYKHYDYDETFGWTGSLTTDTPGATANGRYVSTGGSYQYAMTRVAVTTPQQDCDDTTTTTQVHRAAAFDRVELLVYLDPDPHAVLKAQCGTRSLEHTVFCGGSTGDVDTDDARTIAHGDSGRTGVVRQLSGGRLEVTFDVTTGSLTGRPFEYERITARFELKLPCKVDLAAKGVADSEEESVGALVIRNADGNEAPRLPVSLRKVKGLDGDLVLGRVSSRLKVFTAAKGGSEIAFDGSANRFANASLPRTVWVEGFEQSEAMRDAALTLEMADDPECKDTVKFTVLWVEPPEFRLTAAQSLSPDDAAAPPLAAAQGDDRLGFHTLTNSPDAGPSWSTETSGRVHPDGFSYPGIVVAIAHAVEFEAWGRTAQSAKYRRIGREKYVDVTRKDQSIILKQHDRDDDPSPDDRIYNLNAPGLSDFRAPAGFVARVRANVNAAAYVLKGKRTAARCSEFRDHWLRFSVVYTASGSTTVATPLADVPGDNDAQEGAPQKLSWNLQ
jgi:hypothetical protein